MTTLIRTYIGLALCVVALAGMLTIGGTAHAVFHCHSGMGMGCLHEVPALPLNAGLPLKSVGRLLYTNPNGEDKACSGTVVDTPNGSVVSTAAHCLDENGDRKMSTDVRFCPGYENGAPFGCWHARALQVAEGWNGSTTGERNLNNDYGTVIVQRDDQKRLLKDVVGGVRLAFNREVKKQLFSVYGYPDEVLQSCGPTEGNRDLGGQLFIPCSPLGSGASGGPWLTQIGNTWYLNGSTSKLNNPLGLGPREYSPYFDDKVAAFFNAAGRR
jgi:hypothetical protein